MDPKAIIALPEHLQVVLFTGYLGYAVAYAGYRDNESKYALLFGVVVFGTIGYMAYSLLNPGHGFVVSATAALLAALAAAVTWRRWGRNEWVKTLRLRDVSLDDGTPDIWSAIIQNPKVRPTEITVFLKNGESYKCGDVDAFKDAPFPYAYYDTKGNIAIYATRTWSDKKQGEDIEHVRDPDFGDRLYIFRREDILYVSMRVMPK